MSTTTQIDLRRPVRCCECPWTGWRPASDEYEAWVVQDADESGVNPQWQPGDVFGAFPEPCPECGETVTLDMDRLLEVPA